MAVRDLIVDHDEFQSIARGTQTFVLLEDWVKADDLIRVRERGETYGELTPRQMVLSVLGRAANRDGLRRDWQIVSICMEELRWLDNSKPSPEIHEVPKRGLSREEQEWIDGYANGPRFDPDSIFFRRNWKDGEL